MNRPAYDPKWPDSWKLSYTYDLLEIFDDRSQRGYTYAYENRRDVTLGLVQMAAKPPATILDIAAAQGNFSIALANLGFRVTWNDLREDLQGYVRIKDQCGTLTYLPGNAFEVAQHQTFDVVLATEIIEHCAHPDEFLSKAASLVTPGGHIVITTPLGNYFRNTLPKFSECEDPSMFESIQFKPNSDGHIFLLHRDELIFIAKSVGLEVKKVLITSNPLTSGHLKTEHLLKLMPQTMVRGLERFSQKLPERVANKLHTNIALLLHKPM